MSLLKKMFAHQIVSTSERFQDINTLEQRLWQRDDAEQAKLGGTKTFACLVGFSDPNLTKLVKLLRDVGVQKISLFTDISQLYEVVKWPTNSKSNQQSFSHVFINLDSFRSLESGIDLLLDFRKIYRSARIILISAHSVSDDFGDEKSSICDITLSLPISFKTLKIAINSE
jgi:hypothetical protein